MRVIILSSVFAFIFAVSINAGTFLDDFNDGNDDGWTVFEGNWHVLKAEVSAANGALKAWVDGEEAMDVELGKMLLGR